VKTPRFRSSASLSRVTRCDQRFGDAFVAVAFLRAELVFRAVVLAAFLRAAGLRVRAAFRRSTMIELHPFQAEKR
jgi:hypothetical protein